MSWSAVLKSLLVLSVVYSKSVGIFFKNALSVELISLQNPSLILPWLVYFTAIETDASSDAYCLTG